jgi:hypothetical protein
MLLCTLPATPIAVASTPICATRDIFLGDGNRGAQLFEAACRALILAVETLASLPK